MNVSNNQEKSRFEVDLGDAVALAAYHLMPGAIAFTHTEVPPSYEGQGIGTMLIKAGLGFAREQGLKVVPACRFFAAYMIKHEEVQDLLDAEQRSKLGLA
ncbi:N-acetyltransferase [Sphingomonas piscis]|uniref:N-acetyltransferase n=1 Tax=Sphingomonas piscis TaxID=2714943 RepID=A0A6G7YNG6_9SPHN|nr:GNAT family N-acetyltransferase [Sphingomonas piscis]QIK78290.1 N-acetyltransferase [Sphingomonas piscis]